jgi:hypothetical protein
LVGSRIVMRMRAPLNTVAVLRRVQLCDGERRGRSHRTKRGEATFALRADGRAYSDAAAPTRARRRPALPGYVTGRRAAHYRRRL